MMAPEHRLTFRDVDPHDTVTGNTADQFKHASTATLTTQLFKRGLRNVFLQGVRRMSRRGENMVGEAFTLRYIPAREDLDHIGVFENPEHPQRKAIEMVPPGTGAGDGLPTRHARGIRRQHSAQAPRGARRGGRRHRWRSARQRGDRVDGHSRYTAPARARRSIWSIHHAVDLECADRVRRRRRVSRRCGGRRRRGRGDRARASGRRRLRATHPSRRYSRNSCSRRSPAAGRCRAPIRQRGHACSLSRVASARRDAKH